jgi:hypothetical protein
MPGKLARVSKKGKSEDQELGIAVIYLIAY